MFSSPKTLILAFLGGITPSLLWLWFWLKEDRKRPEPVGMLAFVFLIGMASVFFVLPVQKFLQANIANEAWQLIAFAGAEEIVKYIAAIVLVYQNYHLEEPIDWPIYLITAALGFAALENTLFLLKPFSLDQTTVGLLTGHLRFLGSTLLHTVASAILGTALGLSFHMDSGRKKLYLFGGLFLAIVLHTAFNFFIIRNDGNDFLKVFAFLWVVTIIVMLLFEKVRRMSTN